jgi:hypothetical protein
VSAVGVLALAVLVAAGIGARRGVALLAALGTVLVGALSLFVLTHLALAFGPAGWVPSDSAALTPAARLAQSRTEAGEGYLGLILVGVLAAIALLAMAFRERRDAQIEVPVVHPLSPLQD